MEFIKYLISKHIQPEKIETSVKIKVDFFFYRLSTFGNAGNAHYDYPKDSDMMELFQCTKTQTNRLAVLFDSTFHFQCNISKC